MAYTKKDNYPSLKKPGVYPSGSIVELGLDGDNLEKFSLGSWPSYIFNNKKLDIAPGLTYNDSNITDVVRPNVSEFNETLFGFAYKSDLDITNKNDLEIDNDEIKLFKYYDNQVDPDDYSETSYPVEIKFGVDHFSQDEALNFDNITHEALDDYTSYLNDPDTYNEASISANIIDVVDGGHGEEKSFEDETLTSDHTQWTLRYTGAGSKTFEQLLPANKKKVRIKYNFDTTSNDYDYRTLTSVYQSIKRPNVQLVIEFTNDAGELRGRPIDIKIMDKIQFGGYSQYQYKVVDIRGNDDGITQIYLDKFYLGAGVWATQNYVYGQDRRNAGHPASDLSPFDSIYDLQHYNSGDGDENYTGEVYPVNVGRDRIASANQGDYGNGTPQFRFQGDWDAWQRNDLDSSPISFDGMEYLWFGDSSIITRKPRGNGSMMFGNPTGTSPFSNVESSVGLTNPPLVKLGDGGQLWSNYGDNSGLVEWPGTGINFWDENSHDGWNTPYNSNRTAINTTINAKHGWLNHTDWRHASPEWHHESDDESNRTSGPVDIDHGDVKLPVIEYLTVSPYANKLAVQIHKDSSLLMYGGTDDTGVFSNFPRQGYYRVRVKDLTIVRVDYSGHIDFQDDYTGFAGVNLSLSVGVRERVGNSVAEIDTSLKTYTYNNIFSKAYHPPEDLSNLTLTSNIFRITPTDQEGTVELDVFIKVVTTGFYTEGQTGHLQFYTMFGSIDYQEINVDQLLQSDEGLNGPVYKYKVLQWGDEKKLLTDDNLLNTFYFKWYDNIDLNLWDIKKYLTEYNNADYIKDNGIVNITSHVYNTPGVKSIKAIVFRTDPFLSHVFESKLLTTNIVINDGTLTSQDFSIFGGTDFNFLPLKDNEAIIGGLDEDSKYNNSVERIKKDDNFIIEDYLQRASSKDFIDNFNKKLYGETPGQLDLSTTRMYKKPLDIYDFINADKLEWITQGSGSLPINSSATDIFISNEDCTVDLNPQDIQYLSIQNKTGTTDKAILIGDYKVNQPKDGRVQKQGVMQTPLLEQNTDKQAF
jgi:hypothetical protein